MKKFLNLFIYNTFRLNVCLPESVCRKLQFNVYSNCSQSKHNIKLQTILDKQCNLIINEYVE